MITLKLTEDQFRYINALLSKISNEAEARLKNSGEWEFLSMVNKSKLDADEMLICLNMSVQGTNTNYG